MKFAEYKYFSKEEEKKARNYARNHHGTLTYCQTIDGNGNIALVWVVEYYKPVYKNNALYYCIATNELITEKQFYFDYYLKFADTKNESFVYYLSHSMTRNNGELIEIKPLPKKELIKIVKRAYKDFPPWERDETTDKLTTWEELQKLSRAELYGILYEWHDDEFTKLVIER